MDYGDDSDGNPMSTDILEDIRDRSQSHTKVNRREAQNKLRDHTKKDNWNAEEC